MALLEVLVNLMVANGAFLHNCLQVRPGASTCGKERRGAVQGMLAARARGRSERSSAPAGPRARGAKRLAPQPAQAMVIGLLPPLTAVQPDEPGADWRPSEHALEVQGHVLDAIEKVSASSVAAATLAGRRGLQRRGPPAGHGARGPGRPGVRRGPLLARPPRLPPRPLPAAPAGAAAGPDAAVAAAAHAAVQPAAQGARPADAVPVPARRARARRAAGGRGAARGAAAGRGGPPAVAGC